MNIATGEFEIEDDTLAAPGQLLARFPDAQPWLVRISRRAVHGFGYSRTRSANGSNMGMGLLRDHSQRVDVVEHCRERIDTLAKCSPLIADLAANDSSMSCEALNEQGPLSQVAAVQA